MGLTVKHFTDAFKKTGVKPIQGTFCEINGIKARTCSACAFTALYLSAHNLTEKELIKFYKTGLFNPETMETIVRKWADNKYGQYFVSDFITSFDTNDSDSDYYDSIYGSSGRKLGVSVRKAVFNKKK